MAELVYLLCAVTSILCAGLLMRGYRRNKSRLLLWSVIGFSGLAINNILLVLDLAIWPAADLSLWRSATALFGYASLLFGLLWDVR